MICISLIALSPLRKMIIDVISLVISQVSNRSSESRSPLII